LSFLGPRRARSFAAPTAGWNCRWLKALSDKKGYHGSLPVPSVTPRACCVQYCQAPALPFPGETRALRTGPRRRQANLVNENGAREEIRTPAPQILSFEALV
jgi:hypothetical protein